MEHRHGNRRATGVTMDRKPVARLTRIEETVIMPESITSLGGGSYLIDLGKVYAGVPRITFSGGTSGTTISMAGGYVLSGNEIDSSQNQAVDMSYYAVLNGSTFTYEPVEYLGMRYFQIDNAPMTVTTDNFEFVVRHSTMDTSASSFTSSDATLNAVWDLMKHSLLTCAQEEFVDTPTREKGGFLGDAAIQSTVAMPVMNERTLTRRVLGEYLQSMDSDEYNGTGRMNAVYPNNDGARDIPDFTQDLSGLGLELLHGNRRPRIPLGKLFLFSGNHQLSAQQPFLQRKRTGSQP